MKDIFKPGDTQSHRFVVKTDDVVVFKNKVLHEVCSTYKLGEEMEWSSRLFMLEMIDSDEEGVGTMLHIDHLSPAYVGDEVFIVATFRSFEQNHLSCDIEVSVGERLVAKGKTGQKLISKDKLKRLMTPKS